MTDKVVYNLTNKFLSTTKAFYKNQYMIENYELDGFKKALVLVDSSTPESKLERMISYLSDNVYYMVLIENGSEVFDIKMENIYYTKKITMGSINKILELFDNEDAYDYSVSEDSESAYEVNFDVEISDKKGQRFPHMNIKELSVYIPRFRPLLESLMINEMLLDNIIVLRYFLVGNAYHNKCIKLPTKDVMLEDLEELRIRFLLVLNEGIVYGVFKIPNNIEIEDFSTDDKNKFIVMGKGRNYVVINKDQYKLIKNFSREDVF